MRLLLILISFLSLKSNSYEYFEYEILPGDTLLQIAADHNQSLSDIYEANKSLNFNPNKILAGSTILIKKAFAFEQNDCPDGISLFWAVVYDSSNPTSKFKDKVDLLNKCIDEQQSTLFFKMEYEEGKEYLEDNSKVVNSLIDIWLLHTYTEYDSDTSVNAKLWLCDLVEMGSDDALGIYSLCNFSEEKIKSLPFNEHVINAMLYDGGFISIDEALKINYRLLPSDYRSAHVSWLAIDADFANHPDAERILNNQYTLIKNRLLLSSSYSSDIYEITNLILQLNKSNMTSKAQEIYKIFIKKYCGSCSVEEAYNGFVDRHADAWHNSQLAYFQELLLGGTSTEFKLSRNDKFFKDREKFIEVVNKDTELLRSTNLFDADEFNVLLSAYSNIVSDTGLQAASDGKCDYASEKIDEAIDLYKELKYILKGELDGSESPFSDPSKVAICYLKKGDESAHKYMKIANDSKESIEGSYYYEIISSAFENFLKDVETENILNNAYKKIISTPKEYISIPLLDDFYLTLDLIFTLQRNTEAQIIDYIKLKNLLNSFSQSKSLLNIKISSTNKKLEELREQLVLISEEIARKEIEIDYLSSLDREEIINLYRTKTNLVQEIFTESTSLNDLYQPGYSSQDEIHKNLGSNQKVIIYFFLNDSTWLVVLDERSSYVTNVEYGRGYIVNKVKELSESIGSTKFDFSTSHNLYNIVFREAEKHLSKNDAIYIYDLEEINIPFPILTKTNQETKNYERAFLDADWLLKDYSFAFLYPSKKKDKQTTYSEKYLGLANTSSYSWSDLPALKSAEKEITNLGITSNADIDDILVGENATKENFISKLSSNFERVVIATHAVPAGWKGYINESALIMPSKKKDFFLTPSEIAQTKIQADMVILSSCSGISSDFRKLYKSFLVAGAESVVHANWQLESKFAAEFTDEFFKELWLRRDLQKHEAMRNVALSFLDDYSNPLYADPVFWGNFSIGYSTL